jgi:4-amino-4-deoxy-L-arabinose transferase-like glycosyltransferase
MGLSFLSKGPVSFYALFLPFILSYLWIFKPLELKTKWPLLALAFSICVFISSLWPLYILNFHPEALLATVQQESQAWVDRHVQPLEYYLKFPAYSGLWLVVTIAVLVKPFAEKRVRSVQNYRFLLLWLVLAILLLSLIPEKKYRYLLPAMIPLALLSAVLLRGIMDRFRQGKQAKGDLRVIALHAFLISIVGVIYACVLFYQLSEINGAAAPFFTILVFSVFLIIVVSSWHFFKNKKVFALFSLTVVQSCFIAFLYMDFYREVNLANPEYKRMTKIDSSVLPLETNIFFMHYPPGIKFAWDLNRQVKHWRVEEARQLLESGETIAVISRGNPYKALTKRIGKDVEIQIIDRFDYKEKRPQKTKILLSKVRLRE